MGTNQIEILSKHINSSSKGGKVILYKAESHIYTSLHLWHHTSKAIFPLLDGFTLKGEFITHHIMRSYGKLFDMDVVEGGR